MLANWVKETTATTGTGTITLAGAVDNSAIPFSDVAIDGQLIPYTIEDGDNREIGLGTYTASGTTLARTVIRETLVSGVIDNTAPTAITLSGSAIVSITDAAQSNLNPTVGEYVASGDVMNIPDLWLSVGQPYAATANQLVYFRGVLLRPAIMTSVVVDVSTLDASAINTRAGLYTSGSDGLPHKLLFDSGNIDVSATGMSATTLSGVQYIPPGVYWWAFVTDSTVVRVDGLTTNQNLSGVAARWNAGRAQRWIEAGVSGALPATASPVLDNSSVTPAWGWW